MIEIIKKFTCDFCEGTTEINIGSDTLDYDPDTAKFNIIRNDDGDFCDEVCHYLFCDEVCHYLFNETK
ncbi:MAG: hypothetical protein HQ509_09395 [Candidatus Marinimicrobia bacterium]|nr:hypothetical protein [Candidatus Neomarinimicrobiota bacterium]